MASSEWSDVDQASDPSRMILGLDRARDEAYFQARKARLAELLAAAPGEVILDVGCGTADDGIGGIGVDNSLTMVSEARRRHPSVPLAAADARVLPLRTASVDAVVADRVLQHLDRAAVALAEWWRVLRPGGRLVTCDPDLTAATIEGVDETAAHAVVEWRAGTRPGRHVVADLPTALTHAGFADVHVEAEMLELTDLHRADGIFGLATWGGHAADDGALDTARARRWRSNVETAWRESRLRYTCPYFVARGIRA